MCACEHACVCACVHACMCACMHVCMCAVCMCAVCSEHRTKLPDLDRICPQIGIGIELDQPLVPGPIVVKSIEPGSAAARCGRVRRGDVVHSVESVLCHQRTLQDMQDYIWGDPMSTVTIALLKPGVSHSVLAEELSSLSADMAAWVKAGTYPQYSIERSIERIEMSA